jgi:sulfide:quinone oxidoreductase
MSRITVIGAGFAALTAVRRLRKSDGNVHIDLIAPKPEFVYFPGTIWIPTGLREPKDLVIPLDNFFRRKKVTYHAARVTGLSTDGREVETTNGAIANDGLIIASGGRFIRKLPGIEHSITPCGGIDETVEIRDRLAAMDGGTVAFGFSGNPHEQSAMRGGPVFEFLFGIDNWLRKKGRRDRFKLVFFSPAPRPGGRLGPKAVDGILAEMKARNIEMHIGHKLKAFEPGRVITHGGEFTADLVLFIPGMTGNRWFDNSQLPRSAGGLITANAHCRVENMPNVYVAGDSGSFPGPDWMPKQAHMADLQAEVASDNLLAELAGKSERRTFKVELLCIIDSYNKGMLVARTEKRNFMLPSMLPLHWTKRIFEWMYLRKYR